MKCECGGKLQLKIEYDFPLSSIWHIYLHCEKCGKYPAHTSKPMQLLKDKIEWAWRMMQPVDREWEEFVRKSYEEENT